MKSNEAIRWNEVRLNESRMKRTIGMTKSDYNFRGNENVKIFIIQSDGIIIVIMGIEHV